MKLTQKIAVNYLRAKLNMLALVSKKKAAASAFELFCTPLKKSKRKKPPVFLKGEKLQLKIQGLNIEGYRWNEGQAKKCLIVHGFESTSYNFEKFINPLVKKGYEVLAFDAPAHGISEGRQITLPLYIKTLQKIDDKYGPISAFIAHSFGGLAVSLYVEKTANKDRKLVLIAPATETTTAIDSFFQFLRLDNGIRPEFDQIILQKEGRHASDYSIRRAMHHIHSQVLWIHDEEDDMTPIADALKIKSDHHPNVEFIITKGLGHRRIYRDNNVMKTIFEFL